MNISENGIKNIINFEGLKLKAYKDSVGIPTIGIGTIAYPSGSKVKIGDVCTKEQAIEYLKFYMIDMEKQINSMIKVKITQNQYDALCSFCYNLGHGALKQSTLLKKINLNDFKGASDEFLKWNKAGGKVIDGLTKRRNAEKELFLEGL
jgi:lysozyme